MKYAFMSALLGIFLAASTFGQQCEQEAWVHDDNPNGTKVRAAPSSSARVIEVFPKVIGTDDDIDLVLVGYRNGWLQIRMGGGNRRTGWIQATKVGVSVENPTGKPATLYALPRKSSRRLGTIPNDASEFDIVGFSCFGLKIRYKNISGWLAKDQICGNPRTTCP